MRRVKYPVTCRIANLYLNVCRWHRVKPTWNGLRRYAGAFGYEMLQGRKKTA